MNACRRSWSRRSKECDAFFYVMISVVSFRIAWDDFSVDLCARVVDVFRVHLRDHREFRIVVTVLLTSSFYRLICITKELVYRMRHKYGHSIIKSESLTRN